MKFLTGGGENSNKNTKDVDSGRSSRDFLTGRGGDSNKNIKDINSGRSPYNFSTRGGDQSKRRRSDMKRVGSISISVRVFVKVVLLRV